jgi:DNA-binding transcriptional ArsR family regulator
MTDEPKPLEPPEIEVAHKMIARGNPWTTALGITGLHGGELSRGRNIIAALGRHGLIEKKPREDGPRFSGESRQMLYRIREGVELPPMPAPRTRGKKSHAAQREEALLRALAELPPYSLAAAIAEKTGIAPTTVGDALRGLVACGLVDMVLGDSPAARRKPWLYFLPSETPIILNRTGRKAPGAA